ncbi:MAG: hypothetical protein KGI33_00215 [Thaumarchaeota archaeon]|nr:hypothetical protein [Nitrososphaerota archaeon]
MTIKTILILAAFLAGQMVIPIYAQSAPEMTQPGESPFEHGYNDVKFLDAYFGYPNQKIEVQPGDQNVPLTILFSNVGTEDIAGIRALLSLPIGFSAATPLVEGLIEADTSQAATAGSSFTLTFYVNLDKSLQVHDYSGTVKLTYSRVRENGVHQAFYDFNFKVTGRSVLNMNAENPFIQPASNNQVTVKVSDNGTAPINNVDISLNPLVGTNASGDLSNLQNVVIDQRHWNVGTVQAGMSKTFSFNAFIPQDIAGQSLHVPLTVTYFDGQGNQITKDRTVDLIVGPANSNFNIKLSTPSYIMMGVMQNLTVGLENLSPSKISNVAITITPSSSDLRILDDPRWYVNEIPPLTSTDLRIPVFADQNIANQAVNFDVNMQYTKDGSTVIESQSFASYIRPVIDVSVYGVQESEIAGQKMIIGNVLNEGNIKGQFAIVTIDPLEGSTIKEATQYIGDIDIDAPTPFNVPVQSTTGHLSGDQRVLVTLTYKDTLLQPHTLTQTDTISFGKPAPETGGNLSQLQLVILVAIAAGIGGIVFKIKKKPREAIETKVPEAS